LLILAGSPDPFNDVPGKYWDLSPSGLNPIVEIRKVFISIEERQFTNDKHYIIRPRFLHPSRDSSWLLSVDPMTALECIRRGLGPHTVDIANFLISHGVHFRALQRIPNSPNPSVRPHCRYLGYRSDYSFDLADFAGYEALCDFHSLMGRLLCVKVVSSHAWQGRFCQIPMLFLGLLKH
jgi:hypothetical protein